MRIALLALLLTVAGALPSAAQVQVVRQGDENPVLTIAKATFWGGVTGLLLGGAAALVAEENEDDYIRWFFVGGTFGGFGFGVYHVMTRDNPSSSLRSLDGDMDLVLVPTSRPWSSTFLLGETVGVSGPQTPGRTITLREGLGPIRVLPPADLTSGTCRSPRPWSE